MNTSKYTASDVLGRQQNWINKVASLRVSNVRIGQHITSLLKDQSDVSHVDETRFKVSFAKVTKLRNYVHTIVGGSSGIRVWQTSTCNPACATELVYEDHCATLDACFASTVNAYQVYTLLPHNDGHVVKLLGIPPSESREVICSDVAEALRASSGYVLVSLATGTLRILNRDTLEAVTQVVSVSGISVVCSMSSRWLALQIEQSSSASIASKGNNDVQDTALRFVSGLYVLSRVSWKAVSPYLHRAVTGNTPAVQAPSPTPKQTGGGIAIIDLHPSAFRNNKFSVLASFSAHHDSLACMAFAPSGLRIASCDTNGQTILIHALCAAGSLTHHNTLAEVQSDGSKLHVQLLYKLMRGISLSTIVHINFDSSESLFAAATLNGTLHIFSMDRTHESDSRHYQSSRSNSDTSSANDHDNIGPSSWTAPITDVNQLLQLSRSETRLLYGYSELRVKLPLRENHPHREEEKAAWNPIPVNVASSVAMHRCNDGGEGVYDVFAVTSEGLLCRYRINAPPSGAQTSSSALTARELHRFDLTPLFDISDSFVHCGQENATSEHIKKNAWLHAASDTPDPVELPMWFRPQMRLRSQTKETKGSKKSILFAEQQESNIMRIQRYGPALSTQKEKSHRPPKSSKLPPHPPAADIGIEGVIRDAVNSSLDTTPHEPIAIKSHRNSTYEDLSTWEMDIDWEESDADSKS